MIDTATRVLRDAPFTADLGRAELERLASLARPLTVPAGTVLCEEGAATTVLGIVASGRAALRLHVPGRGAMTVLTVEPGDVFGWSAVVPPYRSTSTVQTTEPTETLVFDAERLRDALATDADLAAVLYGRLLRVVARRLEATRLQLLDVFGRGEDRPW